VSVDELPEPFIPIDTDVRDLDGFMLNVERLLASELWALSTGSEFKAAVTLWCRAWKQVPAGSLPDNERVLASFSGAGRYWPKVREMALRGFVKCSDGRLYHKVLCDDARRAAVKKAEYRERTRAATEARRRARDGERDVERDVARGVNVTTSQGQGQGQGQGQVDSSDPNGSARTELLDAVKALWDRGLRHLTAAKVPEKQARSIIGKWRREFDDTAVMAAIMASEAEMAAEPIAFISACLKRSRAASGSRKTEHGVTPMHPGAGG
jgi:hypothetical protein